MIKNIIITGIGGQGVITTAGLLRFGILSGGYRLTGQDNRGGAQRLGHVAAIIRFTDEPIPQKGAAEGKRSSKDAKILDNDRSGRPMAPECPEGECDLLISLEISEGLRFGRCLGKKTVVVHAPKLVIPTNQRREKLPYFSRPDCRKWYKKLAGTVFEIDGDRIATEEFGVPVLSGMILLGAGLSMIKQTPLIQYFKGNLDRDSLLAVQLGVRIASASQK